MGSSIREIAAASSSVLKVRLWLFNLVTWEVTGEVNRETDVIHVFKKNCSSIGRTGYRKASMRLGPQPEDKYKSV